MSQKPVTIFRSKLCLELEQITVDLKVPDIHWLHPSLLKVMSKTLLYLHPGGNDLNPMASFVAGSTELGFFFFWIWPRG